MPVPIAETLGIFADNTRKRKSVLPLPGRLTTAWTKGLGIPAGGETILYTGQMYQMIPAINSMSRRLAEFEDSWVTRYFGLGRSLNRLVNLTGFLARSGQAERDDYNRPLRNVSRLLHAAGIEFGCLYEEDLYAGALAYDEGLDDVFASHAARVYRMLKSRNIKRLITVDPHTTHILRTVYPRFIDGFDIRVQSYLEVLAEGEPREARLLDLEISIHDSCLYARHENVVEQPRLLISRGGVAIQETELSGRLTHCCGGPLESLFPGRAAEISARRTEQFAGWARQVATMCPLCLANLRRTAPPGIALNDISEYLVGIYCPEVGIAPGSAPS